ncbi:hypothetical protein BHE74_00024625, partial [Ensete ventricosum]
MVWYLVSRARFAISVCTAWYGRYIPVRQVIDIRLPTTRRYRQKSIVGGRLREKKGRRRRRGKEEKRRGEKGKKEIPSVVLARGSPTCRRHPRVA